MLLLELYEGGFVMIKKAFLTVFLVLATVVFIELLMPQAALAKTYIGKNMVGENMYLEDDTVHPIERGYYHVYVRVENDQTGETCLFDNHYKYYFEGGCWTFYDPDFNAWYFLGCAPDHLEIHEYCIKNFYDAIKNGYE